MSENLLSPPRGAVRKKTIVGRGRSSGSGKTSGKGHKGQKSRSGGGVRTGFEGGQMPLYRRVASRGFSNHPFKKKYTIVNLAALESKFQDGETVSNETLVQKRLTKKGESYIKILGFGTLTKKLNVTVAAVSSSAKESIEKAGGTVTLPETAKNKESDSE